VNIKGKGISKHNITLIVIVSVLLLNSLCQHQERDKKQKGKLNFPIYPGITDVNEIGNRVEGLQGISYFAQVAYPSKEVFEYYEKKFDKMGFVMKKSDFFPYNRKWEISYDDINLLKPISASIQAFWVNDKNRQAIWLQLSCDLREKNKSQFVSLLNLILDSKSPIDSIDVYDEFCTALDSLPGTKYIEDNIIQSEFSGFYSLEREFDFRIIHEIEKGTDIKSGTYTLPDRDGRYHMVSEEPLIERDDIDFIEIVTVYRKYLSKEKFSNSPLGEDIKDYKFYQLYFHFKNESISKIKDRFKLVKGPYIGIICNKKVIYSILVINPDVIKEYINLELNDESNLIYLINRLEFKKK